MRKLIFYLFISLLAATAITPAVLAQTRSVSGIVKDENGNPLAGATINSKGSKNSTTSDGAGSFKISVPATARTLVISYVGMTTEEYPIPKDGVIAAVLKVSSSG
ncbi:MAG: carboxypeptidase-like regulatory domain-containing protein, partial [Bacteroidota bacterium]